MIVAGSNMVRISRDRDLPLHYEASPLRVAVSAIGWPVGILAIAAGIAAYVGAASYLSEAVGALLVLIGCTVVVVLVRCRRYEVTVGRRMTELRSGPFRRTLPTACVERASERPASSWRRFFAPWELVLTLSVESRPLVLPTHDPDELRTVLIGNGHKDESPSRVGGRKSEIRNPKSEMTR